MSYCANCGTQLEAGQKFCANCGTPVPEENEAAQLTAADAGAASTAVSAEASFAPTAQQTSSDAALQKLKELKANLPVRKRSSRKILTVTAIAILMGGITAIGAVVYVGSRAKQSASTALNKLERNGETVPPGEDSTSSPDGNAHAPTGDPNDDKAGGSNNPLSSLSQKLRNTGANPLTNMATSIFEDLGAQNHEIPAGLLRNIPYSAVKDPLPCPAGAKIEPEILAKASIRFASGTILTDAWAIPHGDIEGDHTITSVDPDHLKFQYYGAIFVGDSGDTLKGVSLDNTLCAEDVVDHAAFSTGWNFTKNQVSVGLYPGVSRILLPGALFQNLKTSGSMTLVFAYYDYQDALTEWELGAWKGTLTRVERDDIPFALTINDQRMDVPAIHVHGEMKVIESAGRFGDRDQPADFYILDDAKAPVVLSCNFGENLRQDDAFRMQLIRVRYPDPARPTIEQQLAKDRKAITWGITFDFNSDVIRPESEPLLKEIAQAMADKPDWRLTIAGHTDNIGGHKYNLGLSQRRSAAVKKALVDQHHADVNRLSTGGYGDSVPIDTNDTLEGRARNRRVELTLD